jgi:lactate dehydrogenase-like 2-hydroxyacid dehydrogenase
MTGLNSLPARREVVLMTHLLPQWIGLEIENAFELRIVDLDCEPCRRARVMITPGPARVDTGLLEGLPALEYIAAIGSGIEGIDTAYTSRRGIVVSNSAAATADDVADHTLALTLALYSRIVSFDQTVRAGEWPVKRLRRSLCDLHVGIVGLGAIGTAVTRRLAPLGCAIYWNGPRNKAAPYEYVADLGALARWADILVITARADSSNVGLIGPAIIDALGPEGLLVNVSRGSIVDEDALIAALRDRRLGGAALDVFQVEPTPGERWRDVPNTILTPHIGGFATSVQRKIQQLLTANLKAFFAGRALSGVVEPYLGGGT